MVFSAEEPLVTSDVKDFIETVSRGSLTTPHVCTFDLVRCGLFHQGSLSPFLLPEKTDGDLVDTSQLQWD